MEIILNSRRAGKTTELIKRVAETGGYIVCRSKEQASNIFHNAKLMNLDISFPLTYREFLNHRYYGKGIKIVYIDDADELLKTLTDNKIEIKAITLTRE